MIKILIVDDEKPIANLIRLSLKNTGYVCDVANDGNEALDLIDTNVYDLILLDIMLPEVDGFEIMEYIRPLGIPVIFLTGAGNRENFSKIISLGPQGYVLKSTNRDGLLKILKDYLGE